MKRYRFLYGGVVLVTIGLLLFYTSAYLFGLAVAELVLPVVLYGMLRMETIQLQTELVAPHGCIAGEACPMYLEFQGRTPFAATGMIRVCLEFRNNLYGRRDREELWIPSAHKKLRYEVAFQAVVCGEEEIVCREIILYDILGLTSVHVQPMTTKRLIVSPRPVPVQLLSGAVSSDRREGEKYDYRKKGNDTSEVFDLREYQPGDDVRSIHWKLSSKFEHLVVKEAGYSSHFDMMVLFDGGMSTDGKHWDETVIAGALDFTAAFSQKLLELQRPHYIAQVLQGKFVQNEVSSFENFIQHLQQGVEFTLPEKTGEALSHFMVRHMEKDFSKLIYITNGRFPEAFYRLAEETDVTGICITDESGEIRTAEKGKSTLIEIPLNYLYDETHYIFI